MFFLPPSPFMTVNQNPTCKVCGKQHDEKDGSHDWMREWTSFWKVLKRYYKWAILASLLIVLNEELTDPSTKIHSFARYYLDQPTFSEYLSDSAK
jgi:hypothetical protein